MQTAISSKLNRALMRISKSLSSWTPAPVRGLVTIFLPKRSSFFVSELSSTASPPIWPKVQPEESPKYYAEKILRGFEGLGCSTGSVSALNLAEMAISARFRALTLPVLHPKPSEDLLLRVLSRIPRKKPQRARRDAEGGSKVFPLCVPPRSLRFLPIQIYTLSLPADRPHRGSSLQRPADPRSRERPGWRSSAHRPAGADRAARASKDT